MKKNNIKYLWMVIALLIIVFVIGCLIGNAFTFECLIPTKDVSIVDIMSLVMTVICTIFITSVLEKELQDNRVEKDIFITQISHIEMLLDSIEINLESHELQYTKIVEIYSNSNKDKARLLDRLKKYNSTVLENGVIKKHKESLLTNFKSLKPLLTDTPVNPEGEPDIEVKNGIIKYSKDRVIEIKKIISSLSDDLFVFKMEINRS